MDPICNPFSPGAGNRPPELAGRNSILDQSLLTLERIKRGRSEKSLLIVGLRGTGKTVLLQEITRLAKEKTYQVVMIEAHEGKSLPEILLPDLRRLLLSLDSGELSTKVKRALQVFKSFISSVTLNFKINEMAFDIGIDAEKGSADSGDLEADLAQVFLALGDAAKDKHTAIAIVIDELQYLKKQELSALIMAVHKISQQALPLVVIGAGLPQLVGHAGRAKSYAERLFDYPELGPLTGEDARLALQEPAQRQGVSFTEEALKEIICITKGYPYFLQEWGYQAWNIADQSPIDIDSVKQATSASLEKLDKNFFRVRFDRLTPKEKEYLRALAELGPKTQRSGDIAEKLHVSVQQVAPVRNSLINKGMIYSPNHGDTTFTVPLFGEFMKRIMPNFGGNNTLGEEL